MTGNIALSGIMLFFSLVPSVPFSCVDQHRGPCTFDENGRYHSNNDSPAAYDRHGRYWYKHGVLHRVGGPAAEMHQGDRYWYENGKLIRSEVNQ